jgi:hypothetical protein
VSSSQLNLKFVVRTVLVDGPVSGWRDIDSLGSILRVSAGPYSGLNRMKAGVGSLHMAYVVETQPTQPIYLGSGTNDRDVGDRVADQLQPTSQVYLIHSNDSRFGNFDAQLIEAWLIETAVELGVPLANRFRPFGRDGLARSPDHDQLVVHARILLSMAGFKRFDEAQQVQSSPSMRFPATSNLHDVKVLDPETMVIPEDAVRMQLNYGDMQAEGYTVGKRFYLLPGADYSYLDKKLSTDNLRRRRAIEAREILDPTPGVRDRARLRVGLDCESMAIAGKILSGAHIDTKVWHKQTNLNVGAPT